MAIKMMTDKSVYACRDNNGKPHYRAGVTEQGGVVWDFGSIALTADGKALMLDSSRVWHDISDGSEVSGNG